MLNGRTLQFGPFLLWMASAAAVATAVARISVWMQPEFAPVVVYPLMLGGVFGAAFAGLAYVAGLRGSQGVLAAVVLLSTAASLLEHAFFYRDYRASFESAREQAAQRVGFPLPGVEPETFVEYLRSRAEARGRAVVLWVANPLITAAVAGVVFWYLSTNASRPAA
jgi:hypothetical protein